LRNDINVAGEFTAARTKRQKQKTINRRDRRNGKAKRKWE
jgi:hypothetical protein